MRPRTLPRPVLSALLLAAALSPGAHAGRGGAVTYPKVATYVYQVGQFTPAQRETLSWFDVVTCRERPDVIADMRARNPQQRILHRSMPQNISADNEDQTFWHADTAWCLIRLCQFYAMRNDWYLYDTAGRRIADWDGYAANWTRYCPRGTYGTSRGMTYAEWYINVALPQIAYRSPAWERWGWGSGAYDGIAWEVFFDCPACCEPGQFRDADPDRDGQAEGIAGDCWDGGFEDSLSILYRETNVAFRERMQKTLAPDLVVNINRGGTHLNPPWAWKLNGLKLEDWRPVRTNPAKSWWSWMYGRRSAWSFIGDGYQFAERYMHPTGIDEREGWDLTWLMVWTRGQAWSDAYRQRMQRWGLGTTLLGDGYFIFTVDQHYPKWLPSFDWDFGAAVEDYQRELYGADTLYVRRFEQGFVEVNPNPVPIQGVAGEDARFAFWLTVDDLAVESAAPDGVTLTWLVPDGELNQIQRSEVRYATWPITPQTWETATPAAAGPAQGAPGERLHYAVTGLDPETRYYFALRNTVFGRAEPGLSNVVDAVTGEAPGQEEDHAPPSGLSDLRSPGRGTSWVQLTWTATGDDGTVGVADHYLVRRLAGRPIAGESDWALAVPVTAGVPAPAAPGTAQGVRVEGLVSGTTYGFAVRVVDEADNVSALSNPLQVTTDTLPDVTPPAPIADLRPDSLLADGARLRWTAPGDDGAQGRAASYVLGYLEGGAIASESAWSESRRVAAGLPTPAAAGSTQGFDLHGLRPGVTYGLALRAYDDAGNLSSLGNSPLVTPPPEAVPDTIPPAAIEELAALAVTSRGADLRWSSTGDDGYAGRSARFVLGYLEGGALATESDWQQAQKIESGLPAPQDAGQTVDYPLRGLAPERSYAIAVRAYDDADLISPLGYAIMVATPALPDTLSPAAIEDLRSAPPGADACDLTWSAPGDDGASGTAHRYELRYLPGRAIDDEADWSAAQLPSAPLPSPGAPGSTESFCLGGLEPSTAYGISVRAWDEAGHRAPLSNPLLIETAPPPDLTPPGRVADLGIDSVFSDGFDLAWTAPGDDGAVGTAAFYILGYREGNAIDSEARWASAARETLATPLPAPAGTRQARRVSGLRPETTYGLALRAVDDVGLLSPLSAPLAGRTAPESGPVSDPVPPAAIADLEVPEVGETWARLEWSCPGDDGWDGQASRFEVGWLEGEDISAESAWQRAHKVTEGLPSPGTPGSAARWTLEGLAPARSYSVAVRAYDDEGNLSPLGPPAPFTTSAPVDRDPPARVTDLAAEALAPDGVRLRWTAAGDDGRDGTAVRLIVAARPDQMIESEDDWGASERDTLDNATAGGAPDSLSRHGLDPGRSWGFALRYCDETGAAGPISNFAAVDIPEAPADPDTIPPAAVENLRVSALDEGGVTLCWSPAGDDGRLGRAAGYAVAVLRDERLSEESWDRAARRVIEVAAPPERDDECHAVGDLAPGASYGFGVRAVDEQGNLSPLGRTLWVPALAPGPVVAPEAVTDLRAAAAGASWIELAWSAPDGGGSSAEAYEFVWDEAPPAGSEWIDPRHERPAAAPGPRGAAESLRLASLASGRAHWIALRTLNGLGAWSEWSVPIEARTILHDADAPAPPPAPAVALDLDAGVAQVSWLASPESDVTGYDVFGRAASALGRERITPAPVGETSFAFALPAGEENYFVSIAAIDASGNRSAPGEETPLFGEECRLEGPFPHPIEDEAQFRLTLPPGPAGATTVTGRIYTVAGALVRRWIDDELPNGPAVPLRWDTRSDGGQPVAPGLYFLRLDVAGRTLIRKIYVRR
jgi:chitodextrinase